MDRDDWLKWRRGHIGASEAPAVLGIPCYGLTARDIYDRKLGLVAESEPTPKMIIGNKMEPIIAELYCTKTGATFDRQQVPLRSKDHPFMGATLDGITSEGRIVEFKTASLFGAWDLGNDGESETLPDHWLIQGHHQMLVWGGNSMDFAVLHPDLEVRIYPVERNEALCTSILEAEFEFWDRVQRHDPPPLVPNPEEAEIQRRLQEYRDGLSIELSEDQAFDVASWDLIGKEISRLQKERDAFKSRIAGFMAGASAARLPDGRLFKQSLVTTKPYEVKGGQSFRFSLSKAR